MIHIGTKSTVLAADTSCLIAFSTSHSLVVLVDMPWLIYFTHSSLCPYVNVFGAGNNCFKSQLFSGPSVLNAQNE